MGEAINGNLSIRAVADTTQMEWAQSPSGSVWRKRVHLVGASESGQVTSVVRYEPDSKFPEHDHPEGEEILVSYGRPTREGLRVPIPIEGWSYQGWVDMDGVTVATGEITHASESDAAAPHSGPMPGFDYPGEDFLFNAPAGLTFPISVDGAIVVVTLEPSPDPDPGRSSLELLRGSVPSNPVAGATYFLERYLSEFPDGDIRISD